MLEGPEASGLKIIYYSRRRLSEKEERELGAEYVDLDTLLARSDFISFHVPHRGNQTYDR